MSKERTISCKKALTEEDFCHVFEIRNLVFVDEQHVPPELEKDSDDKNALHLLAFLEGRPVGTARLVRKSGDKGKIGRIAVKKEARSRGIGLALLDKLTCIAREMKLVELFLDAQLPEISYYEKMGYHAVGEVFIDAGIPHRRMFLLLAGKRELHHSQENLAHQEEEH